MNDIQNTVFRGYAGNFIKINQKRFAQYTKIISIKQFIFEIHIQLENIYSQM